MDAQEASKEHMATRVDQTIWFARALRAAGAAVAISVDSEMRSSFRTRSKRLKKERLR